MAPRVAGSLAALGMVLSSAIAHAAEPARAAEPPPASDPGPTSEAAPATAPRASNSLDSLRERFRQGMDKYRAGAFADAIVIWESIYRELGSDKGYRLAFDLARAYDELGDLIKAADHYESYLLEVTHRRTSGEALEANVERQEQIARDRLEKTAGIKARIRVKAAAGPPVIVHVDNAPARVAPFTAYVEPGAHSVTFGAGQEADVRTVTVNRGEVVDVEPHEAAQVTPPPQTRWGTRLERPFSPAVLWIGAGVAVASLIVPVITYANALSIKSDYEAASTPAAEQERLQYDYDSAKANAYASVVVPAVLTAAVSGLAVWYVLGTRETRVPVPSASVTASGASVGVSARF